MTTKTTAMTEMIPVHKGMELITDHGNFNYERVIDYIFWDWLPKSENSKLPFNSRNGAKDISFQELKELSGGIWEIRAEVRFWEYKLGTAPEWVNIRAVATLNNDGQTHNLTIDPWWNATRLRAFPKTQQSARTSDSVPTLTRLSRNPSEIVRSCVGINAHSTENILSQLATDSDQWVRHAVACNPATLPKILAKLATDECDWVRRYAMKNQNYKD